MAGIFVYAIIFLITVVTLYRLLSRQRKESHGRAETKLPPGSMGWPYVGETLQLYSQDPNVFFAAKQKRFFF